MLNPAAVRQLWEAVIRRAGGNTPSVQVAYLCGQSIDNQSSVFDAAVRFDSTSKIACLGHSGSPSFEGFNVWEKELMARGIVADRVVPIQSAILQPDRSYVSNTLTEAKGLADYVAKAGIDRIAIVAPRWHIVRCYMTCLGVYHIPSLWRRFYPVLGARLPWDDTASHSQGTTVGIRADLPAMEMARIFEYRAKGDLPDPEIVLEYLKKLE